MSGGNRTNNNTIDGNSLKRARGREGERVVRVSVVLNVDVQEVNNKRVITYLKCSGYCG